MAKSAKVAGQVRRQGRRVMPALRRKGRQAKAVATKVNLTLGELIAAAFDTVGTEARAVAKVLSSDTMARALNRRIVCA
jgi:hypothetical protein